MKGILHVLCCIFLFVFGFISVNAQEQTLLAWQFKTSASGASAILGDSITYNSTNNNEAIYPSFLSRGKGLTPYNFTNAFSATIGVLTPDYQAALNGDAYMEFKFNVKPGQTASLSKLNATFRRHGNGNDKITYYKWMYSINNGVFNDITDIVVFDTPNSTAGVNQAPVDLSSVSNLQNISESSQITFRIYVWGFNQGIGSGVFAIGRSDSDTEYSLSLNGTTITTNKYAEVLFTNQNAIANGGLSSENIMNRLISLIDNTPSGESIHMSIYMINHQKVMDALKIAEQRGVNIHLIVDMSRSDSQDSNVSSLPWLQNNLTNSEIIVSINDISSAAINHHKFVLFSSVNTTSGKLDKVTFQTSHNFTGADTKKIQDALIFNHAGVYQTYLDNWNQIKNFAASGMSAGYVYNFYEDTSNGIRVDFFPKRGPGVNVNEDNIVQVLEAISDVSNSKIRIAMSDWSDSRPAIIDKLIQLRNQGAAIEVYAKDAAGVQTQVKLRQLESLGATVRIFNLANGAAAKFNIHAKMMLIEGTWKGVSNSRVIITGSHNYTDGALKTNNEALVTLVNSGLYFQYDNYFNQIKNIDPKVPVVQFDFDNVTTTINEFENTSIQGGIVNSLVKRGNGLKSASLSKGISSSTSFEYSSTAKSTLANAIARDEYLQIEFETKNGVKASLNRIEWNVRRSASSAITTYRWYYSIGSENKADFIPIHTADQSFIYDVTGIRQKDVSLEGVPSLQEIEPGKKIYFRLYIYGSINSTSNFSLRNVDGTPGFTLYGDIERELTNSLLAWDLSTSNNGSRAAGNEISIISNITHANMKSSTLKRGAGLNADDEAVTLQRGFTAVSSNVVTTLSEAESYGNYFSFDVSPKANISLSLKTLHVNLRRSSGGGNNYLWRYKINNGQFVDLTNEILFTNTNTNGVYQPVINLSDIAELQNVKADSIVFRLYVWGFNTANSGTFAVGRSADSYDLALQLQGTSVSTPLPVSLIDFLVRKQENVVKLNWFTASEQSNSHFEILKSSDGKGWNLLTTVSGAGNSTTRINYQYVDNRPFSGINYYQLKQVDFDGKSNLSEVASVNFDIANAASGIAASYSSQMLTVFADGLELDKGKLQVHNTSGQLLKTQNVTNINSGSIFALPVTLKSGVYIVSLNSEKGITTTKIIVN